MAEELSPIIFRKSPEAITSFDFQDVAKGQSYLTFYGLQVDSNSTNQESYESGDDGDLDNTLGNCFAQTFQNSEKIWVNSFYFYGRVSDNQTYYFYLTRVDENGKPDLNNIIGYTSKFINVAANAWIEVNFTYFYKLDSNITYAIVMNTAGGGIHIYWRADTSAPAYANGSVFSSANSGATWSIADTTKDALFKIYGTTINPYTLASETFPTNTYYHSAPIVAPITTTNYYKRMNIDYDLEIGKAIILEGKSFLNLYITFNSAAAVASYYPVITFKKYNGTTETTIGTSTGRIITATANSDFTILINIASPVIFIKGNIFRITIELWLKSTAIITSLNLYQNPENTANDLMLILPAKI